MNYWLLTSTTYGTWHPGDGWWSYTDVSGEVKLTAPQPRLARYAKDVQRGETVTLDSEQANCVLIQFCETSAYRNWSLLAVSVMSNHFHVVIAAADNVSADKILNDLKAYASRKLNRTFGRPTSNKWWTEGGSKRLLPNQRAIDAAIFYVVKKQPNPLAIWCASD